MHHLFILAPFGLRLCKQRDTGLCRAGIKTESILQEVAADQAIMQLLDARGTLLELKVS